MKLLPQCPCKNPTLCRNSRVIHMERYLFWLLRLCMTHMQECSHAWVHWMTWDLSGVQGMEQLCFPEPITSLDSEFCQMSSTLEMRQSADWDCMPKALPLINEWLLSPGYISHVASMGSLRKAFMLWGTVKLVASLKLVLLYQALYT